MNNSLVSVFGENYFDAAYGDHYYRRNPDYKWRAFFNELLKHRQSGKLLEVGCGYGPFLHQALKNFQCTGCDISDHAVNQARKKLPSDLPLFCSKAEEIGLAGQFDVITAFDVIEHVPHLDRVFDQVNSLLNKGGLFIFSVPVYDGILGPVVRKLDKDTTHVHQCSRDWWLEQASKRFIVKDYIGIWRYFFFNRYYLNIMSRFSRRTTTAIYVVCEK